MENRNGNGNLFTKKSSFPKPWWQQIGIVVTSFFHIFTSFHQIYCHLKTVNGILYNKNSYTLFNRCLILYSYDELLNWFHQIASVDKSEVNNDGCDEQEE